MIDLNYNQRELIKDFCIIIIIVTTPFAFYLYTFAPKNQQTWTTSWFSIDAGWYDYIDYFLWLFCYKALIIILLSIWYVTCRNWWRYIVLVPIVFETFKFGSFICDYYNLRGDFRFVYGIPLSILNVTFLKFLAKKLSFYNKDDNTPSKLNSEIIETYAKLSRFNHKDFKAIKIQVLELRKQKNNFTKKDYLAKLIVLRNQLTLD